MSLPRVRGTAASAPRQTLRPLLLVLCLLCLVSPTVTAYVYTAVPTAAQLPSAYAAANPTRSPIEGLYAACTAPSSDPNVSSVRYGVVTVYTANDSRVLTESVTSGQVYLGGYYVTLSATLSGWCWNTGRSTACPGLFCTDAACTVAANNTYVHLWAAGYPQMTTATSVGTRVYMAYDAALQGWINVDGTAPLNGVACSSQDIVVVKPAAKFPWWAILIIVLGCVAIIAVVIVVCCCCCCKKKKKSHFEDDEDTTAFGSRSASFSSRGTSYSETSGSFSSRSGSSKGSSFTGSSRGSSGGGSYSETSGSFSTHTGGSSEGSSVTGSSRSSAFTGSSSVTGTSRGSSASSASSAFTGSSRGSSSSASVYSSATGTSSASGASSSYMSSRQSSFSR